MNPIILYGSETGTDEDIAFKTYRILSIEDRCNCRISGLRDYDPSILSKEIFVIFLVSTTGDGEVPSNMKSFWNFLLKKSLHSSYLCKLKFAVFGFGDSSYEKFNVASR